jgi:ATP-binding cassette subfamily B protein
VSSRRAGGARRLLSAVRLPFAAARVESVLLLAATVVQGLLPVASAWSLGAFLDALTGPAPDATAGLTAAAGIALSMFGLAVGQPVSQYLAQRVERAVRLRAQGMLFDRLNRFVGLAPFEQPAFQDRVHLAQDAGAQSPSELVSVGLLLVQSLTQTAGWIAALLVIWPPIVPVVLIGLVPAVAIHLRLGRHTAATAATVSPHLRREVFLRQLLLDPTAAKELRLFGVGEFLRSLLLGETRAAQRHEARLDRRALHGELWVGALGFVLTGATVAVATYLALTGQLSPGDLAVFVGAAAALQGTVVGMASSLAGGRVALLLFGHFDELLHHPLDLPDGVGEPPELTGSVEFRDVWFRYGDDQPWVLRGVDLVVPAGTTLGLVGANGAGKSTLVKLLCRMYDPQRGQVLWDGVDVRTFSSEQYRRRLSVVFQDFMAYDLSAAQNIGLGDLGALDDLERIRAAARLVGVDEQLAALPGGYRTLLSRLFPDEDGGVGALSGGQWQRVALARAVLRDPCDVLVLDEPSAGLDAAAEHALGVQLRALNRGRTRLLISHRLGSLREADHIVVLDGGTITERGRHADLLAAGGSYAHLFELQSSGYRDTPDRVPEQAC